MFNAWIDSFKKQIFGKWTCYMDTELGVLTWYKPNTELEVRATPNWEDSGYTPIEYGDGVELDRLEQFVFADANEYYEAMKPFLEKYENATRD